MNHCINCKHYVAPTPQSLYARCGRAIDPNSSTRLAWLVNGGKEPPPDQTCYFCTIERNTVSGCGPDGRFWEAKL